ncbi:hypothetical protein [Amycolatopsis sp. cg9]|uniref:hypothetical protein n=1 Tax=Amycolatopsis sp. cg9 TaxID=3238801 RepID=UPI003525BB3A
MHRESDRHPPRADDELKAELRGTLQGNGRSRAEEWRDPESAPDDDTGVPPIGGGA